MTNEQDTLVSGHADPEGEAPWAMQLVARIEKTDPPTDLALLTAAARAVVWLLADERANPGGEWHASVQRWLDGRIRKIARRARSGAWDKAHGLPGITCSLDGAEVRAFVPGPVDMVDPLLSKMQMQGFDVPHEDDRANLAGSLRIAINPGIEASLGKLLAQVGHASNVAWLTMPDDEKAEWATTHYAITIVRPDEAGWTEFLDGAQVLITDAGFTEIPAGSQTTAARW